MTEASKEAFLARVRAEGRFALLDTGAKQGRLGLLDMGTLENPELMCCLFVVEPNGKQYMLPLAKMLTSGTDDADFTPAEEDDE